MSRHNSAIHFSRVESESNLRTIVFVLGLVLLLPSAGSGYKSQPGHVQSSTSKSGATRSQDDPEELRKTIRRLSAELDRLRKRVAELEKIQQTAGAQERLSKEEQRAENLQAQLLLNNEKETAVQARLDEVNEQLRPENIDEMFIGGAVRPEEIRESTRRRLTNEKQRLQQQLDLLRQNKARLHSSLADSDQIIQRLRLQINGMTH